ncbi:MAG: hypothetical protein PHW75_00475 [Patescibacteria group bacterium]|nr:hypothetical protein [Patescibacteria group bacterium]
MKFKPIKIPRDKSIYACYLRSVFKDPDFLKELSRLRKVIEKEHPEGYVFVGTREANPPKTESAIKALAAKWKIDRDYLINYLDFGDLILMGGTISAGFDSNLKKINIDMDPEITREEFMGLWPIIETVKKNIGVSGKRKKELEDPDLYYAIYRARENGMSFPDITKGLSEDGLPNYNNTRKLQLDDVKEKYYRYKKGVLNQ